MKRLLYIFIILASLQAAAQQIPTVYNTRQLVNALDSFRSKLPIEKLYLRTDKPYYTVSDTLRFKAYLLNADFLTPSTRSGLLYIELVDIVNHEVKKITAPVINGITWGIIVLDERMVPEGNYTLRAYTSWMMNFGEDYVFKKSLYVSPLNDGATLVNAGFKLKNGTEKDTIISNLNFTNLDGDAQRLKDMRLRIKSGNKTLFRAKAATGMDGNIPVNFLIPDKTQINNLTIQAQKTGKGADTSTLVIPVTLNRPENADVQFLPEGGDMIAGIITRVGFKAIGENGRSVAINGTIYNQLKEPVIQFKSLHKGMGSFIISPKSGEQYSAIIKFTDGTTKTYPLPTVKASGTAIRITPHGLDSLDVILSASPDLSANRNELYHFIGQARGVVCYAATLNFKNGEVKKTIAKACFR